MSEKRIPKFSLIYKACRPWSRVVRVSQNEFRYFLVGKILGSNNNDTVKRTKLMLTHPQRSLLINTYNFFYMVQEKGTGRFD